MNDMEMFTLSLLDLQVVTDATAAAAYIGSQTGDVYNEPMVVLKVHSATAVDDIENPPATYFAIEPEHAVKIATALARAGLAGLEASNEQKGRPST